MSLLRAYALGKNQIAAYLSKDFYGGVSNIFKLRNEKGQLINLNIVEQKELEEDVYYLLDGMTVNVDEEYMLRDEHNLGATVEFKQLVRTEEFDEEFFYDGDDLGNTYTKEQTTFKVWSPVAKQMILKTILNNTTKCYTMEKNSVGVWSVKVEADLDGCLYTYLVKVNGEWKEAVDPYAYSSTPNGGQSVVINLDKCFVFQNKDWLAPINCYTEIVPYELHIRDFSISPDSGMVNKGKFLAFTEKNTKNAKGNATGLDYVSSLGITHVQIMPMYDFGSVDEENVLEYYNWGYDPVQFGIPEGGYASNVYDPYSRVIECKKMIAAIHDRGLRVIMDVVYNHMFSIDISAFDKLVPYYYFRYGKNFEISNGSFCGNDVDSTRKMCQKYIIDMCKRWTNFYGIDGMRFDLMGVLDYRTMNKIFDECKAIDPNYVIYGEGWNMPTLLDEDLRATQRNNAFLPNIGHFNDRFRDAIKGATDYSQAKNKGFATGDHHNVNVVKELLLGSCFETKDSVYYLSPNNTINYVECHDNLTVWDKMEICNKNDSLEIRVKRAKLMLAIVALSQGVPFFHSGQEFMRTKKGEHNSYISNDDINMLDYSRRDEHEAEVKYFKNLLLLRKNNVAFRLGTKEEIEKYVKVDILDNDLIRYAIKLDYQDFIVFINPNNRNFNQELDSDYRIIFDESGFTNLNIGKYTSIPALSLIVLSK